MDTRKYDILKIMEDREKATNMAQRERAEKLLFKLRTESPMIEEYRVNLIEAIRHNDERARKRFEQELMRLRAEETGGRNY